jgi:hypothetical protein
MGEISFDLIGFEDLVLKVAIDMDYFSCSGGKDEFLEGLGVF